ncbi:MAG TPA: acyl-CoA dehydrogenase family protein, partial [Polyangiaceae bacterium]|nr:acyl-CoA dehydrogenase family protein [Polyangiaceae bacterium]
MTYAIDETLVAKARELGPLIREHAAEAERERRLAKPVIDAMNRSGITKMLLPESLGGLETDPVTMLRVVEEIASFDSVAGWLLMVSNGGAFIGARFPAETVEALFRDPNDWFMGTAFQPPVEAREVDGGYRLTGQRALASFAHASRWICLTGLVMDGEKPRMAHGMPELVIAMMPAKGVEVLDTWHALGMRGSDSTDVAVRDLFVSKAFTCPLV